MAGPPVRRGPAFFYSPQKRGLRTRESGKANLGCIGQLVPISIDRLGKHFDATTEEAFGCIFYTELSLLEQVRIARKPLGTRNGKSLTETEERAQQLRPIVALSRAKKCERLIPSDSHTRATLLHIDSRLV